MIKFHNIPIIFLVCLIVSSSLIVVVSYQYYETQRLNSSSQRDNFNFIYFYDFDGSGKVLPYIEVDTFEDTYANTFTSSRRLIHLKISRDEMDSIYLKMMEVGFFNYPDSFSSKSPISMNAPTNSGFISIYVEYNNTVKEVVLFTYYNSTLPLVEEGFFKMQDQIIETVESNPDYQNPELLTK